MSCKSKRRNCPCSWTKPTVVARFAFLMARAFPDGSEYQKLERLFVVGDNGLPDPS